MQYARQYIEQLMLDRLAGNIGKEEDALLEDALQSDAAMQERYLQLQQQIMHAQINVVPTPVETDVAWQSVAARLSAKRSVMYRMRKPLMAAATLLAVTIAAYLLWPDAHEANHVPTLASLYKDNGYDYKNVTLSLNGQHVLLDENDTSFMWQGIRIQQHAGTLSILSITPEDAAWVTLVLPQAVQRNVVLADGTNISMNAGTKLAWPTTFTAKQREVLMDGEAYFDVAKNARQPFVVHARNTDIRVLGTRFNINSYDSTQTITSLVEGSVQASCQQQQTLLKPGQEAVYAGNKFTVQSFDSLNTLSWMQGVYYFDQTPLSVLEKVIPRWFNKQVVFETPALKNKQLNGALYRNQPLSVFLTNLQLTTDITCTIKADVVYLR